MTDAPKPKPDHRSDDTDDLKRQDGVSNEGVPEQADPDKEPLTPSGDQRVAVEE